MRHQCITLTIDTYGHLFPGQEADAVGRMRQMLADKPTAVRATGTDGTAAIASDGRQQMGQRAAREMAQIGAERCDVSGGDTVVEEAHKTLRLPIYAKKTPWTASWPP